MERKLIIVQIQQQKLSTGMKKQRHAIIVQTIYIILLNRLISTKVAVL